MEKRVGLIAIIKRGGLTLVNPPGPAHVGDAYSQQLKVRGGTAPYTFADLSSPALTDGWSFDPSTQILANSDPTIPGPFPFTLYVYDAEFDHELEQTFIVFVAPDGLTLSGHFPGGVQGATALLYRYFLGGGLKPFSYEITSGALPTGIVLNGSTGALTGTYSAQGSYSWEITVTDSLGTTYTLADACDVAYPKLVVTGNFPSPALVGVAYDQSLTITGGHGGYTDVGLVYGTVPPGLALSISSSTLHLSGTPTAKFLNNFKERISSGDSQTADTATQTMQVLGLDASGIPPTGIAGKPYSFTPLILRYIGTPFVSLSVGTLPAWATLDSTTGNISGTPDGSVLTFPGLQLSVGDDIGQSVFLTFDLIIYLPLVMLYPISADTIVGQTLALAPSTLTGGKVPYTFSIIGGSFPPGAVLNPTTGAITGIVTAAGSNTFSLRCKSADGQTAIATDCVINVVSAVYMSGTPPVGAVGSAYDWIPAITGGLGPYTVTDPLTTLPDGLTIIDAATGEVSGTPTTDGTRLAILNITDSEAVPQNHDYYFNFVISAVVDLYISGTPTGATVGVPYSWTPDFGGGTTPYTFSISSGSLPDGLSIDSSTGEISGTPTTVEDPSFEVAITDAVSTIATIDVDINVSPAMGWVDISSDTYWGSLDSAFAWTGTQWTLDTSTQGCGHRSVLSLTSAGETACIGATSMRVSAVSIESSGSTPGSHTDCTEVSDNVWLVDSRGLYAQFGDGVSDDPGGTEYDSVESTGGISGSLTTGDTLYAGCRCISDYESSNYHFLKIEVYVPV